MTEHTRKQIFWASYPQSFCFKMFTLVLLDEFLDGFPKFWFFIVEICISVWYFWVIFENYSMRMLSIHGNDFIAHWAYEETISSHTEHCRMNFRLCSASVQISAVFTWTSERKLSICGNDFIACWAYAERISSHTEHTRKQFHRMLSIRGTNITLQID